MRIRNPMRVSAFIVAAIVFFLIGLYATAAFAQTPDTTISVGGFLEPLRPLILELAAVLLAALIGWLSVRLNTSLGLNIEAKHRDALQSALLNGVMKGLHYVEAKADGITIDLKSDILAEGVRYVQKSVPDAIKFFGLTPERIRELLEAKLPGIEPVANA